MCLHTASTIPSLPGSLLGHRSFANPETQSWVNLHTKNQHCLQVHVCCVHSHTSPRVGELNHQPRQKRITQLKSNAKDAIHFDYWNILLRIQNMMPANDGGTEDGGNRDRHGTQHKGHTDKNKQIKIQSCAKTISRRKPRVLPKKTSTPSNDLRYSWLQNFPVH